MVVLDQEKVDKVKQYLRWSERGLTISDLTSKMDLNRNLVAKYLDMLLISGQVEMRFIGAAKVYTLSHRVPISAMLEFSSEYLIVMDAEQRILQVNEPLLQFLKEPRDAIVGKKPGEISNPFISTLPVPVPDSSGKIPCGKAKEIQSVQDGKTRYFRVKQIPTAFEDGGQGITCIIEDITERKEAAEEIARQATRMEFFSKILQEFIELSPDANIYEKIGNDLRSLIPFALIAVHSYDGAKRILTIQCVTGIKGWKPTLARNFRCDPVGLELPVNPARLAGLTIGKIIPVPGSPAAFIFNTLPEETYNEVARELCLGDTAYWIGFVRHGTLYGGTTIYPQKGQAIQDIRLVETYAQAASIAFQRHIAEKALRKSERLYRSVFENIPDAFYRTDCEGNLIMASPSWASTLGYDSVDGCIGMNIAETWYMNPEQRNDLIKAVYRDGSVRDYEVLLKRKDGSPLPALVSCHLYHDEDGVILGVEGIFREIPTR